MSTAAIVGISAGKRLLNTSFTHIEVSKPFHDQGMSTITTLPRHGIIVCARKVTNARTRKKKDRHYLKASRDFKGLVPCATAELIASVETSASDKEDDDNKHLQQSLESLMIMEKTMLEKQWEEYSNDGSEDKEASEVVRSHKPSARERRLASRRKSTEGCYKGDVMNKILRRNKRQRVLLHSSVFHGEGANNSSRKQTYTVLKREEVTWLSQKIQSGLHLHRIRQRLEAKLGYEPSKAQWAASMNMSLVELNAKLMEYSMARDELKMSNVRLVLSIARKYENLGLEIGDLIREGLAGLSRGIEKFDPSKGYSFSTYVYWWIRQSITRALADHSKITQGAGHMQERVYQILSVKQELESQGTAPTNERVAKALDISSLMVKNAMKTNKRVVSMDMQAYPKSNLGKSSTFQDFIADDSIDSQPWYAIEGDALREDVKDLLESTLTKREQMITRLYYGLDTENQTWEDISKQLGLSRERVRQIGIVSMEKLKHTMRSGDANPISIPSS